MRLPKDMLSNTYTKPRIFLCETDKTKICSLETTNTQGTFKFNSYSELSFEVARTYNDLITGQTKVNPYYDKIESPRLIYLEGFGYFEIQGPDLNADGIKESKQVTAYSLEYTLSQKYLEDFYTGGTVGSIEDQYAAEVYEDLDDCPPVFATLYNPNEPRLSILHLALEKTYGWEIGHIDESLRSLSRQFDIDRQSIYDFLMTDICEKFNCYIEFDTIDNKINVYAEAPSRKFIGDNATNTFILSPPFAQVDTVSVDGYKTTKWKYNLTVNEYGETVGVLILEDTPELDAYVEVIGNMLQKWETDVFVSFNNLSQEINVSYDAEAIKTVLTVTYGDNKKIRESNLGLPYLTDLSYYYSIDWMGQDLYDVYTAYLEACDKYRTEYTTNRQNMLDFEVSKDFEEYRVSLDYALMHNIDITTVGTYYVRSGQYPLYEYVEVTLPEEYNLNTTYFKINGVNLTEQNVENLLEALKDYYRHGSIKDLVELEDDEFKFMEDSGFKGNKKLSTMLEAYKDEKINPAVEFENCARDALILNYLNKMWNQIGKMPLKYLYQDAYLDVQAAVIEMGHAQEDNENYPDYYPILLMLHSIDQAIAERDAKINGYQEEIDALTNFNDSISKELLMDTFFEKYFKEKYPDDELKAKDICKKTLVRLSAFLREDVLQLDDIVETDLDTIADTFRNQQDAISSGKIELQKLCQPQLNFSMTMANIYALSEFEPIIDQFQLGNVIKVGLRSDYIKHSRLMRVDINFDNFSDFSCEFGELTSLRTQSDIHADLLKQAASAGKSVAENSSYWTKGAEQATETDLRIQQGLLDAATQIKAIDGNQDVIIDKYGIHMKKKKADSDEYDDKQGWIVNNQFLYSDDAFKTVKSVFGEYTIGNETYWGLLAEAVIAGYIEGSKIKGSEIEGGIIQIGDLGNGKWSFEVKENGDVYMLGGDVKFTQGSNGEKGENTISDSLSIVTSDIQKQQEQINEIKEKTKYSIEIYADGPTAIMYEDEQTTLTCKVYAWDADITDTLDDSRFMWIRNSNDLERDEIWNNMAQHQGVKSIVIGVDDIDESASFSCEVDLQD